MQEDNLEVIQLEKQNSTKKILPPIYPFVKWAGGIYFQMFHLGVIYNDLLRRSCRIARS